MGLTIPSSFSSQIVLINTCFPGWLLRSRREDCNRVSMYLRSQTLTLPKEKKTKQNASPASLLLAFCQNQSLSLPSFSFGLQGGIRLDSASQALVSFQDEKLHLKITFTETLNKGLRGWSRVFDSRGGGSARSLIPNALLGTTELLLELRLNPKW